MTQQRTEHALAREAAILHAAAQVFTAQGYHGTTMRAIAEAAGLATGTLYLYFPSKVSVFVALVSQLEQLVLAAIVEARSEAVGTLAKLAASVEAALRVFAAHRDLARILLIQAAGASPDFETRLSTVHEGFINFVQHELDEAVAQELIAPLDTRIASHIWVGGCYELVMSWLRRDAAGLPAGAPADLVADAPGLMAYNFRAIGANWPPA